MFEYLIPLLVYTTYYSFLGPLERLTPQVRPLTDLPLEMRFRVRVHALESNLSTTPSLIDARQGHALLGPTAGSSHPRWPTHWPHTILLHYWGHSNNRHADLLHIDSWQQ